jgi:hypothetical protein
MAVAPSEADRSPFGNNAHDRLFAELMIRNISAAFSPFRPWSSSIPSSRFADRVGQQLMNVANSEVLAPPCPVPARIKPFDVFLHTKRARAAVPEKVQLELSRTVSASTGSTSSFS